MACWLGVNVTNSTFNAELPVGHRQPAVIGSHKFLDQGFEPPTMQLARFCLIALVNEQAPFLVISCHTWQVNLDTRMTRCRAHIGLTLKSDPATWRPVSLFRKLSANMRPSHVVFVQCIPNLHSGQSQLGYRNNSAHFSHNGFQGSARTDVSFSMSSASFM